MEKFKLNNQFVNQYHHKPVNWGFDGLGYFIYKKTYARNVYDQNGNVTHTEEWFETVKRVVEGSYSYQKIHCKNLGLPWDNAKAQKSAQKMYDKIFNFKFTPPGRGLWMCGTEHVDQHGSAALNNCAFVSTENIDLKSTQPFEWTFNNLMLGAGVSFDVLGQHKIIIQEPAITNSWTKQVPIFKIPDSRQGWVQALRWKLKAYFDGKPMPEFDYSLIRPAGALIKGFGGKSSGYKPLKQLLDQIDNILKPCIGKKISISNIVDIFNNIARAVVAGNVRRSAELVLGDINSEQYINLKNPDLHQNELMHHRWASNNSIYAHVGKTDYSKIIPNIIKNGQPGIVWLENCKNYSRMNNGPDYSDTKVKGVNPCVTADTKVLTEKYGNITIIECINRYNSGQQIRVLSTDLRTKQLQYKPILWAGMTQQNAELYTVVLSDNIHQIKCTGNHKIFSVTRNDYVNASLLDYQDHVVLSNGTIVKVSSVFQSGNADVFDITVQDNHNFFANNILVHNCSQITLQSYELCNLVQLFPSLHENLEQFMDTLKYAYLYAKSITLVNTESPQTNAVMLKNRRIGVSMTGVIDSFVKFGRRNFLQNWCKKGYDLLKKYDQIYSDWLCIPKSRKISTLKPSGCFYYRCKVKTNLGNMSLKQIVQYQGYDYSQIMQQENMWCPITKDLFVYDKDNNKQKITNVYINGKAPVYEFQTEDFKKFQCTSQHKFLVKDRGWVKVIDLQENDDIISY